MALPTGTGYRGTPLQVKSTGGLTGGYAHILIYGKTKAGKTSTAVTLEFSTNAAGEVIDGDPTRNAIISTQPEEQLKHLQKYDIPYVVCNNVQMLDEAIKNAEMIFPKMKTLIIDDFSEGCGQKRNSVSDATSKWEPFKEGATWAGDTLSALLNKPFNLVLTAFERQDSDGTSAEATQWICPDFPNATAAAIKAKMDFILRISDYKLRTKPDEQRRVMAGNRWPKAKLAQLKDVVEPDLRKLWNQYQEALK